ncbi:MAG: DUF2341 domain-containing protein, partial [Fibrobacteria bacterium]|nr:DUF2341 domain-containing protein [Fibrobacteria bacterium]
MVEAGYRKSGEKATHCAPRTPYAILLFLTLIFPILLFSADYSSWSYSRKIYLNTTEQGSNVTGDVEEFPVLIKLSSTNFTFSEADTDGDDIRFTKSDGSTDISYEIERWSDAKDSAEIWVLIDTVYGTNASQYFYMYWGKGSQTTASNGENVFAASNNFEGVWHLDNSLLDATSGNNDGSSSTSVNGSGLMADGRAFDGNADYIEIADSDDWNFGSGDFSFSTWMNSSGDRYNPIFEQYTDYTNDTEDLMAIRIFPNNTIEFVKYASGAATWKFSTGAVPTSEWAHIAVVRDGSNFKFYINGSNVGTETAFDVVDYTGPAYLGIFSKGGDFSLDDYLGNMDEVRISKGAARSANWMRLCYENQKSAQTLVQHEENYANWTYNRSYYMNTTATGADVSDDVENFPVLVRLNSSNFTFAEAQTNGEDIRFAKSDGTHLNYEIERWSDAADSAEIWVLVDTVYGDNSSQYFKMYWGRATTDDRSCGACVFDTSKNWEGVWHLNDVTDVDDATNSDYDGSPTGVSDIGGNIGHAANYNDADYIDLPGGVLADVTSQITVSLWIYGAAIQPQADYMFWAMVGGTTVLSSLLPHSTMAIHFNCGNTLDNLSVNNYFPGDWEGRWNYWAFTKNTSTGYMKIYVNGVELVADPGNTNEVSGTVTAFTLGATTAHASSYDGYVDEFRVSSTERSADWIKLTYQNQRPDQVLLEYDLSSENYGTWTYSSSVFLNTTSTGADVSDNVLNFPVLVRLNSSNFTFSEANTNGKDIRFAKSDGTHMHYEIERWSDAVDSAEIWVLADTVYGNNSSQSFTMYWGNGSAADSSNGKAVFQPGKNFLGVWHLNNLDSVVNSSDRTQMGTSTGPAAVAGNIGGAADFEGNDRIELSPLSLQGATSEITINLWQYGDALQPQWDFVFLAHYNSTAKVYCYLPHSTSSVSFTVNGETISKTADAPGDYKGAWNNWTFTKNTSTEYMRIYLNGTEWHSTTGNTADLGSITEFALGY